MFGSCNDNVSSHTYAWVAPESPAAVVWFSTFWYDLGEVSALDVFQRDIQLETFLNLFLNE